MSEEMQKLLESIETAENKLNNVIDELYIEAAIYELKAARLRLQAYIVSQKKTA